MNNLCGCPRVSDPWRKKKPWIANGNRFWRSMLRLIKTETICQMFIKNGCTIQSGQIWFYWRQSTMSKKSSAFLVFVGMSQEIELFSERPDIIVLIKRSHWACGFSVMLKFNRFDEIFVQLKLSKRCAYRKISKASDMQKSQRIGFAPLWETNPKNIFSLELLRHFEKYQWLTRKWKILLSKRKDMNSGLVEKFQFLVVYDIQYEPIWKFHQPKNHCISILCRFR